MLADGMCRMDVFLNVLRGCVLVKLEQSKGAISTVRIEYEKLVVMQTHNVDCYRCDAFVRSRIESRSE